MLQRYQQGGTEVLQVSERMTIEECDTVRPLMLEGLPERMPQVVVDLRKLRLIDSAGLELLCDVQACCLKRGGSVRLAAAYPLIAEVFKLTGLDQEFAIHSDVIAAVGAFAL